MGIFNFFSQRSTVSQLNQPNSSISMNSNDSLVKIKNFWKSHRQNCSLADTKDASSSDYLIYGSTLLLWAYGDCSPIKNNSEYPIYFSEECNLTNPHKQHLRLVKDEFLGDPSLYGILNSLTIPKLKEILSTIDCKKSGSKQELVDRIIENSGEHTSLNFLNTSDCYGLTDKGKAFLEEHYDYVELHKHQTYNITFHEYVVERQRTEGQIDFFDISFQILSKRISKKLKNKMYFQLCSDYLALYDISLKNGFDFQALTFLLRLIYLNTCCINTAQHASDAYFNNQTDFSYEKPFLNHLIPKVVHLKNFFVPSLITNIFSDNSLPPSFLSKEEFSSAINEMLREPSFDCDKYNKLIQSRLLELSKLK